MGPLNAADDPGQDFNDSGYVQEEAAKEPPEVEEPCKTTIDLLDLSDDVLLYILEYCSPMDLKALGFSCTRLSTLILDRTLWQKVDARDRPCGKMRMRWLLTHGISSHTTSLRLSGYAREAKGCLGYMTGSRDDNTSLEPEDMQPWNIPEQAPSGEDGPRLFRLSANALPRYGGGFPFWPINLSQSAASGQSSSEPKVPEPTGHWCPGPQITLTHWALARLYYLCTNLRELALEHCVIDCNRTTISMFPKTLKRLSLLGTKCFNLEKSFLHKIQDRLVLLEDLDVSYCEWVEPACMLPLSKLPLLSRLVMNHCPKLSEFVAYASLATRYGFKTLKYLDLRGSPVGDSEVSALGWLPILEELYLSCASTVPRHADHAHFSRDPPPEYKELDPWEEQEPEFYRSKYATEQWVIDEEAGSLYKDFPPDQPPFLSRCVLLTRMINDASPERQYPDHVWDEYVMGQQEAADQANLGNLDVIPGVGVQIDPNEDANDANDAPDPPERNVPIDARNPPNDAPDPPFDAPDPAPNAPFDGPEPQNAPIDGPEPQNAPIDGPEPQNAPIDGPDPSNAPMDGPDANNAADASDENKRERMPRRRNRELRNRGPTGYIISNVGYVQRTFHMYPGDDRLYEYVNGQDEMVVAHDASRRQMETSRNVAGNEGDQNADYENEARRSRQDRVADEVMSNEELLLKRRHEERHNAGPSKKSKEDKPAHQNGEPCATKAAKKYYDDGDCQVSREFIKKSLEDFRKRTDPNYKPDKFDFDSFDGTMKDDDEDDDDGKPKPKRTRLGAEANRDQTTSAMETNSTDSDDSTNEQLRIQNQLKIPSTQSSDSDCQPSTSKSYQSSTLKGESQPSTSKGKSKYRPSISDAQSSSTKSDYSSQPYDYSVERSSTPRPYRLLSSLIDLSLPSKSKDGRSSNSKQESGNPSSNDGMEPSTSKRRSDPSTIRDESKPSTSKDKSEPSTSKDRSNPASSGEGSEPSTSKDRSYPASSGEGSEPSTSKDRSYPTSPGEGSEPSTSKDKSDSSTSGYRSAPATSKVESDPPAFKGESNPSTSKVQSDPSTSKDQSDPSAFKDENNPSTFKDESNPSAFKDESHSSTFKDESDSSTTKPDNSKESNEHSQGSCRYGQRYIRFRHNKPPVVVCGQNIPQYVPNNNNGEPDGNFRFFRRRNIIPIPAPDAVPYMRSLDHQCRNGNTEQPTEGNSEDMARHRILYVNVSRRRHAMYQISMPEPVDLRTPPNTAHMNLIYSSHRAHLVDYANLITDSAIRRFGRADGENINYVNIGPMGLMPVVPGFDANARPNRSNLRIISVTGYNNITDLSLVHLATAAPHLRSIDFTGTRVTESGVEHFKNLRPDCDVKYGPPGGTPDERRPSPSM